MCVGFLWPQLQCRQQERQVPAAKEPGDEGYERNREQKANGEEAVEKLHDVEIVRD